MSTTPPKLFARTIEQMKYGEYLVITGGRFPGPGQTVEMQVDISRIIPGTRFSEQDIENNPYRLNALDLSKEERLAQLVVERSMDRFHFNFKETHMAIGRNACMAAGLQLDLAIVDSGLHLIGPSANIVE